MSQILDWLRDQKNNTVVVLSGSALAVVIGTYWTVTTFRFDHKPDTKSSTPPTSIVIESGIASGHDTKISGPVTIGATLKGIATNRFALEERLERLATRVAREKGVEVMPLRTILVELGEAGVEDEDIPKSLAAKADKLLELRAEIDKLRQAPPELARIAKEAQTLIDESAFDSAREVLARGREAARRRGTYAAGYEADFLAQEANIDDLQLAYRSAAAKYAEAADLVAPFDVGRRSELLEGQARELCRLDAVSRDNEALKDAIDIYRRALTLVSRATTPERWVMTAHNLAAALVSLGERDSETTRLEEAVALYRDLAREVTPDISIWSSIQMHFGLALFRLGERESGTARLEQAVAVYRNVSKEKLFTSDTLENEHNLGVALVTLGERETGTTHLEEAVIALRGASTAFPRRLFPLHWAKTQNNLGIALSSLGVRENGTARLDEAVEAFRAALEERTRARVPLDWALSTGHQGVALMLLAERRSDSETARRALAQIETAITAARDSADALAAYFEAQLPRARALVDRAAKADRRGHTKCCENETPRGERGRGPDPYRT